MGLAVAFLLPTNGPCVEYAESAARITRGYRETTASRKSMCCGGCIAQIQCHRCETWNPPDTAKCSTCGAAHKMQPQHQPPLVVEVACQRCASVNAVDTTKVNSRALSCGSSPQRTEPLQLTAQSSPVPVLSATSSVARQALRSYPIAVV